MDKFKETFSNAETAKLKPLLFSSGAFVKGFVPPDYIIEGILLRGYTYACTAPLASGKTAVALRLAFHVARGLALNDREVEKGCVLYFAGENYVDVTMRWIKLCEEMDVNPDDVDVYFMRGASDLSDNDIQQQINIEVAQISRPILLLIVDTSAATLPAKTKMTAPRWATTPPCCAHSQHSPVARPSWFCAILPRVSNQKKWSQRVEERFSMRLTATSCVFVKRAAWLWNCTGRPR
jgi:hypothetical protein